jgi:hypothetical protein
LSDKCSARLLQVYATLHILGGHIVGGKKF